MTIDIERLRLKPRDAQIALLHNAFRYGRQLGSPKACEAERVFNDLECVWRDETDAKMNKHLDSGALTFLETPECGVLRTMGYRVGAKHEEERLRREILTWVLFHEVPFVHSAGYMRQWGAPRTSTRERKLDNTLMGFIKGASERVSHMQALKHWSDDLIFVREICLRRDAAE